MDQTWFIFVINFTLYQYVIIDGLRASIYSRQAEYRVLMNYTSVVYDVKHELHRTKSPSSQPFRALLQVQKIISMMVRSDAY